MNTPIHTNGSLAKRGGRLQAGFTLTEVMMTVGIAAILSSLAVPGFVDMQRKFRTNAVASKVVSSLNLARIEAIKANTGVIVCAANAALTNCSAVTDWGSNGWIVCYDLDGDNQCDATTTRLVNPIRLYARIEPGVAQVTGPSNAMRFDPLGAKPLGAAVETVSVTGTWSNAPTLATTIASTGLIKGSRL